MLSALGADAQTVTPQIGGGIGQFDGGISAAVKTSAPASCGVGALDLSTGCAQLVAIGVLF
jgi:hypothetical protein